MLYFSILCATLLPPLIAVMTGKTSQVHPLSLINWMPEKWYVPSSQYKTTPPNLKNEEQKISTVNELEAYDGTTSHENPLNIKIS